MKKFLFIDLETTGLNPIGGAILEIAVIVTDNKLNELETYSTAIHQDKYTLDGMSDWAFQTHSASGLLDEVRNSKVNTKQVEDVVLDMLARHWTGIDKPIISGSSVHFDKSWISVHMSNLSKRLHYRIIDTSSFMEGLRIFWDVEPEKRTTLAHRALPDIKDSIYYLKQSLERFK